ncbi:MAG TPA: hypothetical protein VFZ09_21755 [Archangium sp.]|uniref:hypothetical protein n=1 Tax=Archangium sp. TaxID=1872627 RepID=UPI002E329087|nr:hypothetical protein [Archangium sp.]HEX5748881.1 hypothetical protein [Archangium sp.]
MTMRRTQRERGLELGREKDQVFLKLIEAKAPYEERRRALLELEKQWLREAVTEAEREQLRRGIAEDLVTLAYSFNQPWAEFGKWLRRVQRLGFSNLALRVHITCLYVQSLHLFPRQAREAWEMLADAEKRALRLRRDRPLRQEHLEAIAHAKRVARVSRPPAR